MAIKLTFVPNYATANTVRFDEIVEGGDALGPAEPVFGSLYLQKAKLREIAWKGTLSDPYDAPGANGRSFRRQDVTSGENFVITVTKSA